MARKIIKKESEREKKKDERLLLGSGGAVPILK
jgi:hypothetical protein